MLASIKTLAIGLAVAAWAVAGCNRPRVSSDNGPLASVAWPSPVPPHVEAVKPPSIGAGRAVRLPVGRKMPEQILPEGDLHGLHSAIGVVKRRAES